MFFILNVIFLLCSAQNVLNLVDLHEALESQEHFVMKILKMSETNQMEPSTSSKNIRLIHALCIMNHSAVAFAVFHCCRSRISNFFCNNKDVFESEDHALFEQCSFISSCFLEDPLPTTDDRPCIENKLLDCARNVMCRLHAGLLIQAIFWNAASPPLRRLCVTDEHNKEHHAHEHCQVMEQSLLIHMEEIHKLFQRLIKDQKLNEDDQKNFQRTIKSRIFSAMQTIDPKSVEIDSFFSNRRELLAEKLHRVDKAMEAAKQESEKDIMDILFQEHEWTFSDDSSSNQDCRDDDADYTAESGSLSSDKLTYDSSSTTGKTELCPRVLGQTLQLEKKRKR